MTSSRSTRPASRRTRPPLGLEQGLRPVQVYERLRDQICRGEIAPGRRITESNVAAALGVSRTPARSALGRLLREGYVTAVPAARQVRLRVAAVTREDLFEIFELLAALEGVAARGAASLAGEERAALADALRADTRALKAAFASRPPNYDRRLALHRQFHGRLTDAAAGRRLRQLLEAVRPQAERYEWIYGRALPKGIGPAVREHDAIARAVRAGDPAAAQTAVQSNWLNAAQRLSTVIPTAETTPAHNTRGVS